MAAVAILNDLLQYESLDAGSLKIDPEKKYVYGLFRGRLNMLSMLTKKNDVSLVFEDRANCILASSFEVPAISDDLLDPTQLFVNVDIYKIDQVIRNLVTNAMKFTPSGGSVTIRTSLAKVASDEINFTNLVADKQIGKLLIEVIDTGRGISAENKKKVFGEFVQFDANDTQAGGGSGLGLMICRNLIQMHGGNIGFDSPGEGHGCTFFFELPLYASCKNSSNIRARVSFQIRNSIALNYDRQHRLTDDSDNQNMTE
jgi:signal transduction histidine kinase